MKEQEIDFNIVVITLATKEKEGVVMPGSIPKLVGDLLLHGSFKEETPVRKLLLAQKIAKEENRMLNKADFDLVFNSIENPGNGLDNLIKGQLLLSLGTIKWDA